jgi:hypothetical protein
MGHENLHVRLFLPGGSQTGLKHFDLINFTVQLVIIPREQLKSISPDFKKYFDHAGVYILRGAEDVDAEPKSYVGESDDVAYRLQDHLAKKDWWSEVVIVSSKDKSLTKSQVQYLEARMLELGRAANRRRWENSQTPKAPEMLPAELDASNQFLGYALDLLAAAGIEDFKGSARRSVANAASGVLVETVAAESQSAAVSANVAEFRFVGNGFDATAEWYEGLITVSAGSTVCSEEAPTTPAAAKAARAAMLSDGTLIREPNGVLRFARDREFHSASLAAGIVAGGSRSGPREWKHASGLSLKEWLDQGQA